MLQITEMEISDSIGRSSRKSMAKKIEFSGVPFYIAGSKIYDCQHGKTEMLPLKGNSNSNAGKYTTGQMTFN